MAKRRHQFRVEDLSRFLVYILGHRPFELGLVPDEEGFVTYKELLQAIHEESGWGYVRRSHINEVLLGRDRPLFEADDKQIRVQERQWQLDRVPFEGPLPKVLLTPVRRRAHPVVMEKGLRPVPGRFVVLCSDHTMARRIGMRRDPDPVLIEVSADGAAQAGIPFYPFGHLFLSQEIPVKFITGPPVSVGALEARAEAIRSRQERETRWDGWDAGADRGQRQMPVAPGSFTLDAARDPDPLRRAKKAKKPKGWKEEARKMRRRRRT